MIATFPALLLTPSPAAAVVPGEGVLTLTKGVQGQTGTPTYGPDATFTYALRVSCSNLDGPGCGDTTVVDQLPEPLVVDPAGTDQIQVSGLGTTYAVDATPGGSEVTVRVTQPLGDGEVGLESGDEGLVLIRVRVPVDASAEYAGAVTNTARVTQSNGDPRAASTPVVLDIEENLEAVVAKTVSTTAPAGEPVPAVPGQAVTWTLRAGNTSNGSVDRLVLQDPADGAPDPYEYLALTGFDTFTAPTGADRVRVDHRTAAGTWVTGTTGALPSDPATLLPADLSTVHGLRFIFSAAAGRLPATGDARRAVITYRTQTRPSVTAIPAGTTETVVNRASASVASGGDSSPDVTAQATVDIRRQPPTVALAKTFAATAVTAGQSTVATLRATVGATPVSSLSIEEPSSGADLAGQGLTFDGFTSGVDWPAGASAAAVTYRYADGVPAGAVSTGTVDTLPTPQAGRRVVGFTVDFTGTLPRGAVAEVPFTVVADPVAGSADVTSTNTATARGTAVDGEPSDPVDASDDLVRRPLRVAVSAGKNITREWIYAAPGASSLVSLPAEVINTGPSPATVGSEYLRVTDPAAPAAAPTPFWDRFDLRSVGPTEVPAGTTLTVAYWNGATWTPFTAADGVAGPVDEFSFTPTSGERALAQGIRFTYTPTATGALLPPGFEAIPYLRVQLRETLRSDPGTTALPTADLDLTNTVGAEAANPSAVDPTVTDTADDVVQVRPVPSGGGLDLVDKGWVVPPGASGTEVTALTDDERTARLSWSTQNLPLDRVTLTDPAGPVSDDPADLAASVYDTFDLHRIAPISDPLMTFDAIDSVELYSAAADAWVDIKPAACPGTSCDGGFAGYTLTTAERADTLGVRITYVESPTRAARIGGPDDPDVGSGVAQSGGNDRRLDLVLGLRQERRSTGFPVLGDQQGPPLYNGSTRGEVVNSVGLDATGPGTTYSAQDAAAIQIVDRPVNIEVAKSFDQSTLGLPPAGTDLDDYPLATATVTATNDSASKLRLLELTDAIDSPDDPFDRLDLHQIEVNPPAGSENVLVVLTFDPFDPDVSYTEAQAEALTPAQLAGVTDVRIQALGLIPTNETLRATLTFQLRATVRGTAVPVTEADQIVNTAEGLGLNPGDDQATSATATLDIVAPTYDVVAAKEVVPASRTEVQARTGYTVTLSGRPSGTVRTRLLTLTDATPTFWNAFTLTGLPAQAMPAPVEQARLDVLTGVTYTAEPAPGGDALVARCAGSLDLTACWTIGAWTNLSNGTWTPTLPAGITAAAVVGTRVSARRADGSNWERPATPTVPFRFTTERRQLLRVGPDGGANTPVPSTKPDLDPAPGESQRGTFTDTVEVHADGAWENQTSLWTADDDAMAVTRLAHLPNRLSLTKSPGNGIGAPPLYAPDTVIPYVMTIENTGSWPQTGLTVVDDIGTNENGSFLVWPDDPDTGDPTPSYSFSLTGGDGATKPTTGFTAALDTATGELAVALPAGFVLQPSDTLTLRANLVFQLGLEPGTGVVNILRVSNDRILDTCRTTRNNRPDGQTGPVARCAAQTVVEPSPLSPIRAVKSVRGVSAGVPGAPAGTTNHDDLGVIQLGFGDESSSCDAPNARNGFYRHPCVPITRAGGAERWQLSLTNQGNIPVARLAAIDVLPHPGDTGTILTAARQSAWRASFVGNLRSNVDEVDNRQKALRVYYATSVPNVSCNAADIRNEVIRAGLPTSDPCYGDVTNRGWSLLTPATPGPVLATVRAIKVVIDYDEVDSLSGLAPGRTIDVTFDTETPAYAPRAVAADLDPIAYNSFAVASLGTFQGDDAVSSVVEPRKVGVALSTGRLEALKEVDLPTGASFPLPASYPFDLSCSSQGEDVPIADADGAPAARVRLTPGDVLGLNDGDTASPWGELNIPRYADCRLTEVPTQGAVVTFDPAGPTTGTSADVTAVRDYRARGDVANPAYPDAVPLARITATNTYANAGFVVAKTVDDGGAVDADGDPVTYTETYDFTASCTFNGTEVVPPGDRTFTLGDGDDKTFDDLPAGAECTVAETDDGTAASTTHVVTVDGIASPETNGTTASFTLAADVGTTHVNRVDLTNQYTVGSLEITKAVLGLGADWAGNEFRVLVSCTRPGAAPNPVYENDTLIDPLDPTWEIDYLPTGAECTVTEDPDEDGGATLTLVLPEEPVTIGAAGGAGDPVQVDVINGFGAGDLRITKQVEGDTDELPAALSGTYTVSVACTLLINGTDVPLDIPGGATRTLVGDGASAVYTGLPTDAVCEATETGQDPVAQETTISPAQVTIGLNDTVDLTVTNTFRLGSVEVTKTVTGPGGDRYGAGPFQVTLDCTRPGGSGAPVAVDIPGGATRTLTAPELSTVYELLPVDASCVVTESDDGGADSTRVTVDPDGGTPSTVPGTSAPLVVLDDNASGPAATGPSGVAVELANRFDVGSVQVTKRVAGRGADTYGTGPFQTELRCTTATGTGLDVPGGPVRTLRAEDDYTALYDDLPPGAACTLTETRTNGASSTGIQVVRGAVGAPSDVAGPTVTLTVGNDTGPSQVADAPPGVVASIVNRYDVGAVRVLKELTGPGADKAIGPFMVALSCTRVVDGRRERVSAPDGNRLVLGPETRLRGRWTDLPVGARCEVTEPGDGGAARTTITPRVVTVEGGPVTVTVRNHFDPTVPSTTDDNDSVGPPDADQDAGELAETGSSVPLWVLLVAALAIFLGATLMVAGRQGRR
ncbi:DUF5979 domain-containing protein [Nocardioides lianchengensis]|uniref:DUF5979 domain-containing protein n=1 Tax=Nocardioides lianchengensis TaxID=1045774 RepID=UPI0011140A19|nr:DUF5979 domain-containing protein [Nocardioides lianchengensis]NYG09280.1 hypothetical protein [Nocardioides lianchengensis]